MSSREREMSMLRHLLVVVYLLGCIIPAAARGSAYDPLVDACVGGRSPGFALIDEDIPTDREKSLLASEVTYDFLLEVDPSTAAVAVVGPTSSPIVASLAYDPWSQMLYATDTSTDDLLLIDPFTGGTSVVGNTGVDLSHGSAINPADGRLYVVGWGPYPERESILYGVDKLTGAAHTIGEIGYQYVGALDFDPASGVLYGALGGHPSDASLIAIDTETGTGTLVAPTHRLTALAFDPSGQLFGADNGSATGVPSALYLIDKSDGSWSLIGMMQADNILGLAFGVGGSPVACTSWAVVKAMYK